MTRYRQLFDTLGPRGELALGGFLMLGDPMPDRCLEAVEALIAGGVDFLEVGIPFTDPVADGPVIQAAATRALAAGVGVSESIALIAVIRKRHPALPIGVLTYANLIVARGRERFAADLAAAGADSLLIADVPALEAPPFAAAARAAGIAPVLIAAANTPAPTLERIARLGEGYTYVAARTGVTGADRASDTAGAGDLIARLTALDAPPPVLGFGISTPAQVADARAVGAAGCIVGSAIVERLASGAPLEPLVRDLKSTCVRVFA